MMKFKITAASINHGFIAIAISCAAWFLGSILGMYSPLLEFAGALWYLSREVCDIEKIYKWDFSKWNSAEFLVPLVFCGVLFAVNLM